MGLLSAGVPDIMRTRFILHALRMARAARVVLEVWALMLRAVEVQVCTSTHSLV